MKKKSAVALAAVIAIWVAIVGYFAFPWVQEQLLLRSVKQGDASAAIQLSEIYRRSLYGHCDDQARTRKLLTRSRELLRTQADAGNAEAMLALAMNYRDAMCRFIPGDKERALAWALKAAEKDHAGAEEFLIGHYLSGSNSSRPEERAKAVALMMKHAEAGKPGAQAVIGHRYMHGTDLPLDLEKARYWLEKASEQDDESAKQDLELLDYLENVEVPSKALG